MAIWHRSWILLLLLTATAMWVRDDAVTGLAAGAATLAIAYYKGRLIVLDFMELRHAPWLWRGIVEAWLLVVSVGLYGVYWYSS